VQQDIKERTTTKCTSSRPKKKHDTIARHFEKSRRPILEIAFRKFFSSTVTVGIQE
jgi:hypothetical protein